MVGIFQIHSGTMWNQLSFSNKDRYFANYNLYDAVCEISVLSLCDSRNVSEL